MSALLSVEGLSISARGQNGLQTLVRDLSLDVLEGETVAIVGESGCGKSISARAIMGLQPRGLEVNAHRMEFAGKDLLSLRPKAMNRLRGKEIGFILQDAMTSLNPCFTIGDQMLEVVRLHMNLSRAEAATRAKWFLERVGIGNPGLRMKQFPHELSGGLRQRVLIAMAIICQPRLLIADEPTTALDVTIQTQVLELLKELQSEFGMSMIIITHDLGVVGAVSGRTVVMYAGEVVESGATRAVLSRPDHPYTEGLLASLPGKRDRHHELGTIRGTVPSNLDAIVGCGFAERCPYRLPACSRPIPLLKRDDRFVRCILTTPLKGSDSGIWTRKTEACS